MTAFKFRLERVLQLKNGQLRTEECKLENLQQQRAKMQAAIEAADSSVSDERRSIESATFSNSADLRAFDHFKIRAEKDRQDALRKLAAHDESIKKQREVIITARRAVLLLEKLREKRHADWQIETDKEAESLTADFSAAQWLRSHVISAERIK